MRSGPQTQASDSRAPALPPSLGPLLDSPHAGLPPAFSDLASAVLPPSSPHSLCAQGPRPPTLQEETGQQQCQYPPPSHKPYPGCSRRAHLGLCGLLSDSSSWTPGAFMSGLDISRAGVTVGRGGEVEVEVPGAGGGEVGVAGRS